MRLRFQLAAALLIVWGALGLLPGAQAEPASDSKNFSTPPAAPNYFSNESGPVTRTPAPLPFAPSTAHGAVREDETPGVRPEPTTARQPERRIITIVTPRVRGQVTHARSTTVSDRRKVAIIRGRVTPARSTIVSDRRKIAVARGGSSKPARVVVLRGGRPRAARLAHAEPHAARSRPIAVKGQRAGRG